MFQMDTTVIRMDADNLARQVATETREALHQAGLSQRELANRTSIPLTTLSRRLSGAGKPMDFHELGAIANVLGLSATELVLRAERHAEPKAA